MSAGLPGLLFAEWIAAARRWEPVAKQIRRQGLHVWNPILYTRDLYRRFIHRFPPDPGGVLLLGLNPGPHGMAQTGIPFTDCRTAHRRLGLDLAVPGRAPADLCRWLKKESGRWRSTYERSSLGVYRFLDLVSRNDLRRAFARVYVANPCPLLFFSAQGKNVTPADPVLKRMTVLQDLRRETVERVYRLLRPRTIVCLGADAGEALGGMANGLAGEDNVIVYNHPARAVPETWARNLYHLLKTKWAV